MRLIVLLVVGLSIPALAQESTEQVLKDSVIVRPSKKDIKKWAKEMKEERAETQKPLNPFPADDGGYVAPLEDRVILKAVKVYENEEMTFEVGLGRHPMTLRRSYERPSNLRPPNGTTAYGTLRFRFFVQPDQDQE